jgi:hypothetical protein
MRGMRSIHVVGELERHTMRCRRRQEAASVLVARFAGVGRITPARVLACFRLTDSVTIARTRDGWEVAGVFDEQGFDRQGFERRLRAALEDAAPILGWARFPQDGLTLELLLEGARAALPAPAAQAGRRRLAPLALSAARTSSDSEAE